VKDLVGREMTPTERRLLRAYDGLCDLLREPDLAPCVAANLKEAAAALAVAVMDLGLRYERPDDLGL
jgi:hypothetical protein